MKRHFTHPPRTQYLDEGIQILRQLDLASIDHMLELLLQVWQDAGRLFFLGVGGGVGHASRTINDFRKIAGIEAYAPTDNVSEMTARINEDGWDT